MSSDTSAHAVEARSRRKLLLLVVAMGCLHASLFLLSYWLLSSTPGVNASDEELLAFYRSDDRRALVLVGLYVMPFAGIAFLWFCMALRVGIRVSSLPAGELLAGMQLASGILYVALFFASAAAFSVTAVSMHFSRAPLDPLVARQLPQLGRTLLLFFGMRMAAMFVITTARLGRLTEVLPRWFVLVSWVAGVFVLFCATLNRALVLVFPFWLLILCALLYAYARRLQSVPRPRD